MKYKNNILRPLIFNLLLFFFFVLYINTQIHTHMNEIVSCVNHHPFQFTNKARQSVYVCIHYNHLQQQVIFFNATPYRCIVVLPLKNYDSSLTYYHMQVPKNIRIHVSSHFNRKIKNKVSTIKVLLQKTDICMRNFMKKGHFDNKI